MLELRDALLELLSDRIIALRIGGNDLMGCLGLRRPCGLTLYDTPMSFVIAMLAGVMGASGFHLTAPVFEKISEESLLKKELALDVAHGLVGKTAIHPKQVAIIHEALKVSQSDYHSAKAILGDSAPAVFKFQDTMCEPATHLKWAKNTLERAKWHGIRYETTGNGVLTELVS